MGDREREKIDVDFVRKRKGMIHVSDPTALTAFADGSGVFDVDPHCRKLDAFVEKHKLTAHIEVEYLLPCANPRAEKRPVYYGRARWMKRSLTTGGEAA